MRSNNIPAFVFVCAMLFTGLCLPAGCLAARTKPSSYDNFAKQENDSLINVIAIQASHLDSLAGLLDAERQSSAELREKMIQLDDYRKKLEGNVDSFKGENLKLNQSNRILIVFNSLVAVLLIISLVFFLRKIGRKRNEPVAVATPSGGKPNDQVKFTNFEDKLAQLERLGKLREKELLSEEEFVVEKLKILGK